MADKKLQPCPFCGREAVIRIGVNGEPYITALHDKKCFVAPDTFLGSSHTNIKKQIKAWNRRYDGKAKET